MLLRFSYFPGSSDGKESACNAGDPCLIPGLGRSPGGGNGNPLQYSCLENSMDRGSWLATVHEVTKSWMQLGDWHFLILGSIFLQWPHLSSFSLVPYAWLYLSPSLFFLSHFLQQILIFEWIFFCQRSSKWLYFGVLWNAYQVYRFLWDINIYVPCQKKDGEGSKK